MLTRQSTLAPASGTEHSLIAAGGHIRVVRAGDRFVTRRAGSVARHSFAFGEHYDAGNTRFGAIVAVNDETLEPGAGYDEHAHAGLDIVTWVADGVLEHGDSTGRRAVCPAGVVQVLRAGLGVRHSERAAGPAGCRFIQTWIDVAAEADRGDAAAAGRAAYEQVDRRDEIAGGDVVPIVDAGAGAWLHVARVGPGAAAALPAGGRLHVFVVSGDLVLPGVGPLAAGDSARLAAGNVGAAAALIAGAAGAEVLIWTQPAR